MGHGCALSAALAAMGLGGDETAADTLWDQGGRDAIAEYLREHADGKLDAKEAEIGETDWAQVERIVLVRTIDSLWVEHLTELDDMRRGIGLRGYAQQDPLNEFRREAFRMYEEFRALIRHGVASSIFRVTVQRQPPSVAMRPWPRPRPRRGRARGTGNGNGAAAAVPAGAQRGRGAAPRARRCRRAGSAIAGGPLPAAPASGGDPSRSVRRPADRRSAAARRGGGRRRGPRPGYTPTGARIGRNDPCWCGSGAKYKKCHGR